MPAWEQLWHHNSTNTPAGILIMEWCVAVPLAGGVIL